MLIEGHHIKKYFGNRLILDIENIKIYKEEKIGIVGANGVGKTTLMNILSQKIDPDEGTLKLYGESSYMTQLEKAKNISISPELASKFAIPHTWSDNMSGGEKTRYKLAQCLSMETPILLADEPTSNMDIEGIELMEKSFAQYKGALVLISHDRSFLDKLCTKIINIEEGHIKIYHGNYSDYVNQKKLEKQRAIFEHEQYIKEKKRLEQVIDTTKGTVKSIKKTPKRMGNSEARLHKMGGQKAKANLENAIKNIEKRIEHLDVKDKPKSLEVMKLDLLDSNKLHSKVIITGQKVNKKFDNKVIFDNADFSIYNGEKVALIGSNGCGKSTLINMIVNGEEGIKIAQGAKIGYFSQDMNILEKDQTIIENVMNSSIYDQTFARILLGRLLFKGEEVYKKVNVLSGGEQVKVSLAKVLLQDMNLLILDEPTNYMDIQSLEVIEEALAQYDRTLLFISHDRSLIRAVASQIMTIEDHKIKMFAGTYEEYVEKQKNTSGNQKEEIHKQILLLENRLSEIIGKLSIPSGKDDMEKLDKEYYELLSKIKGLKTIREIN